MLWIIIILVVVGAIAGLVVMMGKGKGPKSVAAPPAEAAETPAPQEPKVEGPMPESDDMTPPPSTE